MSIKNQSHGMGKGSSHKNHRHVMGIAETKSQHLDTEYQ